MKVFVIYLDDTIQGVVYSQQMADEVCNELLLTVPPDQSYRVWRREYDVVGENRELVEVVEQGRDFLSGGD